LFGFGPYPPPGISDDEFLLVLWYQTFFPPSAVLIRRDALTALDGYREGLGNGEDVELWLRLLRRGRFVQVPERLCCYRKHANQFTKDVYRKVIGGKQAYTVMIAQHADRLIHVGLRRDKLWDAYRNHVLLVYYRRQFHAARRLLLDYWRAHPLDFPILVRALIAMLPASWITGLRGRLPSESEAAARAADPETGPQEAWLRCRRRLRAVLAKS
jgi:hypothetical protein